MMVAGVVGGIPGVLGLVVLLMGLADIRGMSGVLAASSLRGQRELKRENTPEVRGPRGRAFVAAGLVMILGGMAMGAHVALGGAPEPKAVLAFTMGPPLVAAAVAVAVRVRHELS